METKNINSLSEVMPNDSRKILCGDGIILISSLKSFITSELAASVSSLEAALQTLRNDIEGSSATLENCLARLSSVEASLSVVQKKLEDAGISSLLGYVYEEDSEGNLTLVENETGEWRTVKLPNGNYTQKFVKIENE